MADLHAIADKYVKRFADTFEKSANALQHRITLNAVTEDLARGIRAHPKSLFELIDLMQIAKETKEPPIPAYKELIQSVGAANGIVLNLDSPFVLDAAKKLTADLITNVNKETKAAIRQMIFEAIRDGDAPDVAQKMIRQVAGLTKRDAMTLKRVAMEHPQRVDRLRAQMVRRRALNIARTETMRAANLGQRATWEKMIADGFLDRETFRIEWICTDDDRLCPECAPMEGETVAIEESFTQTERGVLPSQREPFDGPTVEAPPLHPGCRCTTAAASGDE